MYDDENSRPIYTDGLQLKLANEQLQFETKLKTFAQTRVACIKYFFKLRFEILLGRLFMRLGLKTGGTT